MAGKAKQKGAAKISTGTIFIDTAFGMAPKARRYEGAIRIETTPVAADPFTSQFYETVIPHAAHEGGGVLFLREPASGLRQNVWEAIHASYNASLEEQVTPERLSEQILRLPTHQPPDSDDAALWAVAEDAWDHNLRAMRALNEKLTSAIAAIEEVGRG